tara:strand:+ start:71 stop:793 length:723 start_codon:yes stop_codon:yes gene_type:complete
MSIDSPPPNGFLFAYIDTGVPVANQWKVDDNGDGAFDVFTVPEDYQIFYDRHSSNDFIAALNTVSTGFTWEFSTTTGLVTLKDASGSAPSNVKWSSQLGLIVGNERAVGVTFSPEFQTISNIVPPAAIHLIGAEITEINLKRETKVETFRRGRVHGFSWGGLKTYNWRLTMHRDALSSFRKGWCATGKVRLDFTENNFPITSARWHGYQDAYVLGVSGISFTRTNRTEIATVELLVGEDA